MFFLWYFSVVAWMIPSILTGYGTHNWMIGTAFFITASILQTWINVIVYLIREEI